MKSLLSFILLASLGASVLGRQDWFAFRTTFSIIPTNGFWSQPRTEKDAIKEGYTKISDCGEEHSFPGKRYIPNNDNPNIVLIFDVNGYIAGMQSIVTQNVWNNGYQNISSLDMYQLSNIKGEDVYLTTAYFVDPTIICSYGRQEYEFELQGTGNRLIFQNGADISQPHLVEIPRNQSDLINDPFWKKHLCLFNMGLHYFNLNYDPEESCQTLFPVQLLYYKEKLHGFVWQHFGSLEGKLWEHPPTAALLKIVDTPPNCLLNASDTIGLSTMHIYFRNYLSLCP